MDIMKTRLAFQIGCQGLQLICLIFAFFLNVNLLFFFCYLRKYIKNRYSNQGIGNQYKEKFGENVLKSTHISKITEYSTEQPKLSKYTFGNDKKCSAQFFFFFFFFFFFNC